MASFDLLNHFNIFFGANNCAAAAAFAKFQVAFICILAFAADTALRAKQKAHIAGNAVFLQKLWLLFCAPGAGFITAAFPRLSYFWSEHIK